MRFGIFPGVRTLVWLALLAGGMAGAGWVLYHNHAADNRPPDTAPAEGAGAYATGNVDVEGRVIELYPVLPGGAPNTVAEVLVKENDTVKKGDVLLRMDDHQARFEVARAEAALKDARLKLDQARQALPEHDRLVEAQRSAVRASEGELDRAKASSQEAERLYSVSTALISKEKLGVAEAAVRTATGTVGAQKEKLAALEAQRDSLTTQVERAKADISAKEAVLKQARYALDECELKAPVDGTVLRVTVTVGQLLGPQPREPAISFCPDTPRIIRAEVDQEWADKVKVGQPALVRDDANLGGEWHGKVKRISDWYARRRSILQEPRQLNDVRTLECIIELGPGQSKGLRIGQRVRVDLETTRPPER